MAPLMTGVVKPDLTLKKIPQGFFASYLHISLNSGVHSKNDARLSPVGLMPAHPTSLPLPQRMRQKPVVEFWILVSLGPGVVRGFGVNCQLDILTPNALESVDHFF